MSRGSSLGKVVLVGAGPGAPDLITLRGREWLRRADAVVYDALSPPELVAEAPAAAQRVDVGKRGHQEPVRSQEEINALLVSLAREGKTVVRLKGGDPFVFGRGGEELSALAEAGIPFEVVPGVSTPMAALAFAGIPLTDRRHAASYAVVTGHKDPSKPREEIRWAGLARSADTLVVLMGMRNLEEIVARLLEGGRDPHTPAAVVMNGTLPSQRTVEAPLGELVARVRAAGLAAPAAIVVGDVVRLREQLAWFERLPLFGRRVLVTRAADAAAETARALAAAGAEPVVVPLLRIEPLRPPALAAALDALDDYELLVLTSANAARHLAEAARERGVPLAGRRPQVVCVGPATARAALEAGLPVHHVPPARFDAEGVLVLLERELPLAGRRVLLPRAEGARETLPAGLAAAGARVDAVPVYATKAAPFDAAALRARLVAGGIDALTFASPSALRFFVEALDAPAREAAGRCTVAAIGPVTARACAEAGLGATVVPARAGVDDLVEALAAHFADRAAEEKT